MLYCRLLPATPMSHIHNVLMSIIYRCDELDAEGLSPAQISERMDISPQMVAWLMLNDGYQLVKEKVREGTEGQSGSAVKCNTGER